jgi:hypothetical protein
VVRFPKQPNLTSAQLKQCPDGHACLKDVPIVYGLFAVGGTNQAERKRLIDHFEMWPGGCCVGPDSPKVRPTCTNCGFGYDSRLQYWSRSSTNFGSFKRPFSPALLTFPLPAREFQAGPITYYQSVCSNRVNWQCVSYSSKEPHSILTNHIDAWLTANGVSTSFVSYPNRGVEMWQIQGFEVELWQGRDNTFSVCLSFSDWPAPESRKFTVE